MKKRILALAVTAVLSLTCLAGCGSSAPAENEAPEASVETETEVSVPSDETRVLKLACTKASGSYMVDELEVFADRVNELSDGSLTVEIYPSSQLGGQDEIMEGLGMGTIEMSFLPASVCESFFPKIGVPGTLFVAQNEEHALNIWKSDYAQEILEEMANTINVRCFNFVIEGTRNVWTTKPVNQLSDLNGIKLRVPGVPSFVDSFGALGANPTPMALSEVYTGLQTGIVEGLEMDTPTIVVNKMEELCKYCYKTGHGVSIMSFMIANNLWNELSDAEKEALATAAEESEAVMNEQYYVELEANEKSLAEQGVTFVTPSDEDLAAMAETLSPIAEKLLEGLATGEDLDALRALAD